MAENIVNDDPRPTGLAANYPIMLNNVEYQYFKTISYVRNDYVVTHETESGIQEDVVSRKGRRSIAISVTCLQPLLADLIGLADLDSFEARMYDAVLDDYDTMVVRIGAGSMSYALKSRSERLNTTNGVWEVNFTLEEF